MNTISHEVMPDESINNHERGFRTVVGCVAIAVLLSGFVSTEAEIFAVSLLTIYAMITAILGMDPILDPVYTKVVAWARRLKAVSDGSGMPGGSRHSYA